jgi:hypothetical protein
MKQDIVMLLVNWLSLFVKNVGGKKNDEIIIHAIAAI